MGLWKRSPPPPLTFQAFGVEAEVSCDPRDLEPLVREILPPGWTACSAAEGAGRFGLRQTEPGGYEVTVSQVPWLEHATLEVAIGMLDAQIRIFVAANARGWVFVHAGVVALDGRALVIPGESFSGKTTLVSALVQAGATYYSDEYAVLDSDGHVHPYARRLSIRGSGATPTLERDVRELGGVAAVQRAELSVVLVTRYRSGAEFKPTRVSSGQGVLALMANTVPAQERPAESLRAVSRAVIGSVVLEGDRGEAAAAAGPMLEALTERPR